MIGTTVAPGRRPGRHSAGGALLSILWLLTTVIIAAAGVVYWFNFVAGHRVVESPPVLDAQAQIERGAYLALAGNCAGCHTSRGGAAYAGGRGIPTPFGTVYASNLTPDAQTGIGHWSSDDFWRAMHVGRSRDGRLLYPAFPYPNYTQITREDSDALFAWLLTRLPVAQPNRAHALRFPYGLQVTLAGWRALYFRPGSFRADPTRSEDWNRGAYLVRGLAHCGACHAARNAFGATTDAAGLGGGMIPMQVWYAPSLASELEAGVAGWDVAHITRLLGAGVAPGASVLGPMAEVVFRSTQYLSESDLLAIAVYLKAIPQVAPLPVATRAPAAGFDIVRAERGAALYERFCVDCHGESGEGRPGMYPALAGNRAVTMRVPANVIRVVLVGGYLPGTAGNPRPFGMPPYATFMNDDEVADVVSFIRNAWGNQAPAIDGREAGRYRGMRID
jgi:mono/diheme cytochrome c family protein